MSKLGHYYRELVVMGFGAAKNGQREAKVLQYMRGLIGKYLDMDSRLRVLDLGCGQRCTAVSVFTAWGWDATGIDVCCVSPKRSLSKYITLAKTEGIGRMIRSIARETFFDPIFRRELFNALGVKMPKQDLDVRLMSGSGMEFADNTFELVYSMAVFEHIEDVPAAVREVNRVLKPGGIACIELSLWPSLIGGHHPAWQRPNEYQPKDVPPWDHLRGNRFPVHFYCNKYGEQEFRKVFEENMKIIEWRDGPKIGESLLTDEIRQELNEYTVEDLTKWTVTAILAKK